MTGLRSAAVGLLALSALLLGTADATRATLRATMHSLATATAADSEDIAVDETQPSDDLDAEGGGDGAPGGEPSGGFDASQVMDAFQADLAERAAADRHNIMTSFMHNFAKNMKMAVLSDSQGDMPEDERQRMMAEINGGSVGPAEDGGEEGAPPPPPRRRHRHHSHMLNGGRTVDEERPRRMVEERMLNGGRQVEENAMSGSGFSPEEEADSPPEGSEEEAAAPLPPPRRHRVPHLLNQRHSKSSGGVSGGSKVSAIKKRHALFMKALASCADEDCIKQLYAKQSKFHKAVSGYQQRHEEQQEQQDEDAVQRRQEQEQEQGEADSGSSEDTSMTPPVEQAPQDDEEEQPPERPRRRGREHHPTVRDELGRPMPLLFGSANGAEDAASPADDMPKKSGADQNKGTPTFLLGFLLLSLLTRA